MVKRGPFAAVCCSLGLAASVTGADEADKIWDHSINLRGAFGFKDNVLLSKVQNEQSPFWNTGVDLLAFRLPVDGTTVSMFGTFEDRRYFSASVNKEQTAAANGTVSHVFGEWEAGMELQYTYTDQIMDATVTEVAFTSLHVLSHTGSGLPFVVRHFPWDTWVRVEFLGERDFYKRPLDDFWELGPKVIFGKDFGYRSLASLSYFYHRRSYDHRRETDLEFEPIEGTHLLFQQHEVEGQIKLNLDEARHWRTRFRAAWGNILFDPIRPFAFLPNRLCADGVICYVQRFTERERGLWPVIH